MAAIAAIGGANGGQFGVVAGIAFRQELARDVLQEIASDPKTACRFDVVP
ncbi:MAG TPA: hypothetical protein VFG20_23300 [Planctomycetaceae bacterium]|nr:hypothetical protein [Planctomycetaceae bacterium]